MGTQQASQTRTLVQSAAQLGAPARPRFGQSRGFGRDSRSRQLATSLGIQAKLSISQPGDAGEREADRVAEQVMRMPAQRAAAGISVQAPSIQRLCPRCEDELQRQTGDEEDEELLQARPRVGGVGHATPELAAQVRGLHGGQALPETTRAFFEPRFGTDFGRVRVHTDRRAAESAQALNARAFTRGNDLVFAPGEYAPHSQAGRQLLAHELTHVVQQRKAGAGNTIQRECRPRQRRINNDPNEGQTPGIYQLPANHCIWVLYGFTIGGSEFVPQYTPTVNQLTVYLNNHAGARLNLMGLNDCFGSPRFNMALGNRRAQAVLNAFPSSLHSRITTTPSTGTSYLVPNDTPLRRAINRSVQITLTPPSGQSCPLQQSLNTQLQPHQAGMCSTTNFGLLRTAARLAVPIAITALARVRNWRNNATTRTLLDVYYNTSNDTERQAAANSAVGYLQTLLPILQRPLLDCLQPGHWAYSRVCTTTTIADSGGATAVRIPTFCFPQFSNLPSPGVQASVVLHELSHNPAGSDDYGAYYTTDCMPTTDTVSLRRDLHLTHADSFACFVTVLGNG